MTSGKQRQLKALKSKLDILKKVLADSQMLTYQIQLQKIQLLWPETIPTSKDRIARLKTAEHSSFSLPKNERSESPKGYS